MAETITVRIKGAEYAAHDPNGAYREMDSIFVGNSKFVCVQDVAENLNIELTNTDYWREIYTLEINSEILVPNGVTSIKGPLAFDLLTSKITFPVMNVVHEGADGDKLVTKFDGSEEVSGIDPAAVSYIIIKADGSIEAVEDPSAGMIIVTMSWAGADLADRPAQADMVVGDFLLSREVGATRRLGGVSLLSEFGAVEGDAASVYAALTLADKHMINGATLLIDGDYEINQQTQLNSIYNLSILGGSLKKTAVYSGEYIIRADYCHGIRVMTNLEGKKDPLSNSIDAGEQGIWFRKCQGFIAQGMHLKHFGDAGLRASSGGYDNATVPANTDSFDGRILGCNFEDCYQNTMTHSGTTRLLWNGNTFHAAKGSAMKVASRVKDTYGCVIIGNFIDTCESVVQTQGANDVLMASNYIRKSGQTISIGANQDGVSSTYPDPNPTTNVVLKSNHIIDSTARLAYIENRGYTFSNVSHLPEGGNIYIQDNVFNMEKDSGAWPSDHVIRLFTHTANADNGDTIRANIFNYLEISGNTFHGGSKFLDGDIAMFDGARLVVKNNRFMGFEGTFMDITLNTTDDMDMAGTEVVVEDNSIEASSGFYLTTIGQIVDRLRIARNTVRGLTSWGVYAAAGKSGFSKELELIANEYYGADAAINTRATFQVTCGREGHASLPDVDGTLRMMDNIVHWKAASGFSGRAYYVPNAGKITDYMCDNNRYKGTDVPASALASFDSNDLGARAVA